MSEKTKWNFVGVLLAVAVIGLLCAFIFTAVGCRTPGPGLTTNQIIIGPAKYSMPKLPPAQFGWRVLHSEVAPEPRKVVVAWDYPESEPDRQAIVFRVYQSDQPELDWRMMQFVAEVESQAWTTRANLARAYWTVTASNTLTGLESYPATR